MLDLVRARKIDVIAVYKVDRLTRSLADFAKLVELFDANDASFVSVTQNFNTTSSMGRLTLNVLLSFAQFEREVIGERVRDKIAASKRKGLWVGGPIPLGYASVNKKLVIVPEEAEIVRLIFELYKELGSLKRLAEELDRRGAQTKRQILANGRVRGGRRFSPGPLFYLLKNRLYVGEIAYRGEIHSGEHKPILDRALFEAVQEKLKDGAVAYHIRHSRSPAILSGKLFDDHGNRMSPSHANKNGVRYRYYVSQALLQGRPAEAGRVARISAPDVERIVLDGLYAHFGEAVATEAKGREEERSVIEAHVERVVVQPQTIQVLLKGVNPELASGEVENQSDDDCDVCNPAALVLPWVAPISIAVKGIVHEPSSSAEMTPAGRNALLTAVAKARRWIEELASGDTASLMEIAQREGKVERHIRSLASLAFLSPKIIEAIANGDNPTGLTVSGIAKALPHSWVQQHSLFGLLRDRSWL